MQTKIDAGAHRVTIVRFKDSLKIADAAESGSAMAQFLMVTLYNCGQVIESQTLRQAPTCELCTQRVSDIRGGALVFFQQDLSPKTASFNPLCGHCASKPDREIFDTCRKLLPNIDWLPNGKGASE